MKFLIVKMSLFTLSSTFKMRRLNKMHLLVVKGNYTNIEVLFDDVLVQKFEG